MGRELVNSDASTHHDDRRGAYSIAYQASGTYMVTWEGPGVLHFRDRAFAGTPASVACLKGRSGSTLTSGVMGLRLTARV